MPRTEISKVQVFVLWGWSRFIHLKHWYQPTTLHYARTSRTTTFCGTTTSTLMMETIWSSTLSQPRRKCVGFSCVHLHNGGNIVLRNIGTHILSRLQHYIPAPVCFAPVSTAGYHIKRLNSDRRPFERWWLGEVWGHGRKCVGSGRRWDTALDGATHCRWIRSLTLGRSTWFTSCPAHPVEGTQI
jgi:hypothetical protein